ncbi:MAG: YccF domain-containing protein [Lachnospiraceae bacterium]|jgi:uncharacterized membrane protein YccF (DUF307 family)|nr:YccF domain-containing protein [Lachnospiraceae bacterium]
MSLLGNIIWLIFGGLLTAFGFFMLGCLWCISIIGIPIGIQCFKFAKLSLCPFGKKVVFGGGVGKLLLNIIWLFLGGLEMAAGTALLGLLMCITVIGIPFGLQFFKLAKLSLMPLGARIE